MKTALFLVISLLANAAQAITCMAELRKVINRNQVIEKEVKMPVTHESSAFVIYELTVEEMGYVATFEKGTNRAFVTVARGPDYTEGSNANTSFNDEGRFTLAHVSGSLVGKITCTEK